MWTIYRHARGMLYLASGSALHSEDLQPYQLYRCLYPNELSRSWARPFAMFHENLETGQPRFMPVARVRVVAPEDEYAVLGFGLSTWGEGRDREEFIASYALDGHHLRGVAYLLEMLDGTPVSALNTVRLARHRVGIARVATEPARRRQGYATMLLEAVMEIVRFESANIRFLLFSEVGSRFYERIGFCRIPDEQQEFLPFEAMISGGEPISRLDTDLLRSYFRESGKRQRGTV